MQKVENIYASAISDIMRSRVTHVFRIIMRDKEQYTDNTDIRYYFLCINIEFCHLKTLS